VRIAEEARVVERRLVAALHRPSDGYLARLDRRISTWLSRRLARTPITPNALTTASLLVGLAGAAVLAGYPSPVALLGVALLWASSILDGCDGEVARLTLTTSAAGGRFDIATDHVIHAATFAAIVVHLERFAARWISPWPVAGLFVGVGVSMLVVARAIHRETGDRQLGLRRVCERIASRDYVYVLMLLTFFGHLDWFVWAAAIGANLFWVILWTATRRRRTE
jgi:phosphatidylglycerophosphate synthase